MELDNSVRYNIEAQVDKFSDSAKQKCPSK